MKNSLFVIKMFVGDADCMKSGFTLDVYFKKFPIKSACEYR